MQKCHAQGLGSGTVYAHVIGANQNAGHHASQIPGCRSKSGFVKIVQIEIDKPVIPFVAAEVFHMQIAASQHPRRFGEDSLLGQPVVEQMAGAAKKDESAGAHVRVLDLQPVGIASLVVSLNVPHYVERQLNPRLLQLVSNSTFRLGDDERASTSSRRKAADSALRFRCSSRWKT